MTDLPILSPNLQISFHFKIKEISQLCLDQALTETVLALDITALDQELANHVKPEFLQKTAGLGLRGERVFALPMVLLARPFLLAYYRLLLGFSQKEFYNRGQFSRFKRLEERGELGKISTLDLAALCASLCQSACQLMDGIDTIDQRAIRDLQMLTIGAQLRGSENTRIGKGATLEVFDLISRLVEPYIKDRTDRTLVLQNDSGRKVIIEFGSDPDVKITQSLLSGVRPIVSIEIKGGTDSSNIHNRLGEAEKSHQKAKLQGCFEFWTILKVDVDTDQARSESPTTSRFFNLTQIADPLSNDNRQFRELLASLLGIGI